MTGAPNILFIMMDQLGPQAPRPCNPVEAPARGS